MRICTLNAKGGSGRTTLTLNLAGYFAQSPTSRVLVADCDPQGSALAWAALAEETPFTVGRSRSRGFDIEILDLPPRIPDNDVLPEADLYLIPTLLDGVSYVVFLRTMELIHKKGMPHLIVANRVNERRAEHRERLASDQLKGALIIHERAALASYYAEGRTVYDMTAAHAKGAQQEIERVALECWSRTHGLQRKAA